VALRVAVFNPYTPDMMFGGYEYGSYESAKNLARGGNEVDFICLSNGAKTERINENFRVIHCGPRIKTPIPQLDYFSDVLSNFFTNHAAIKKEYDILFAFNGTFFGGLSKTPTVMYSYGLLPFFPSPITLACTAINRFNAAIAKKIITVTGYASNQFKAHGFPERKLKVIPTGVYADFFRPYKNTAEIRKKYNPDNKFVATYIGRITRDKCDDFLKIARSVLRKKTDAKFFIVGKGADSYVNSLKRRAVEYGIQDDVVFFGPVEREMLPVVLNCTDVFTMASTIDTFGLVNVEAQACKVPVIAYDVSGVGESFAEGKSGLLVKARDAEGFANKIIHFMDNEKERSAMGNFGRKWVEKNLDWPVVTKKIESVFKEVLDGL
jgi:glycosyltransferase involved in cell wall biosynthesis